MLCTDLTAVYILIFDQLIVIDAIQLLVLKLKVFCHAAVKKKIKKIEKKTLFYRSVNRSTRIGCNTFEFHRVPEIMLQLAEKICNVPIVNEL